MPNQQRRAVMTRLWVVAVLAWSLARTFVVKRTLGRYGVDAWAYGAVDLASSWPYAVATAGIVTNLLDGRRAAARRCALVAATAFVAPDLYLILAGHGKPGVVYAVVVGVAVMFAVAAIVSITVELRNRRAARRAGSASTGAPVRSAPGLLTWSEADS
jgi:hypothetical protein